MTICVDANGLYSSLSETCFVFVLPSYIHIHVNVSFLNDVNIVQYQNDK